MTIDQQEVTRRKDVAIEEIKRRFGTEEDEYGATLFVTHHLEELEHNYWQKYLGTPKPEPKDVLDLLVLQSHWGHGDEGDDGIDVFDFTLPGDTTNYVISVGFDEAGNIEDISMES